MQLGDCQLSILQHRFWGFRGGAQGMQMVFGGCSLPGQHMDAAGKAAHGEFFVGRAHPGDKRHALGVFRQRLSIDDIGLAAFNNTLENCGTPWG